MAGPERVLTRRELNRALLERQLLLERKPLSAVQAVERLGGLQAQSTPSPYLSLWTRLDGFERDELTKALTGRRLVKALLQRGTLHVVAPRTYWAIMTVRRELAASLWPPSYEARLPAARIAELAEDVQAQLDGNELTYDEVRALLEPHAREGVPPTFLWRRVQGNAYVIHVPPSGIWGYGGRGVYTAATGKVRGEPPEPQEAFDRLVSTYLAAYGPATKQDVGQWAGVPRMKPIAESLERLSLRTFASEDGKVLYDLPRAPLPDAGHARAAATRAAVRQPRSVARRPLADPGRHPAVADRDQQRPRARDDPRRRHGRRNVAARAGPRRPGAVREARRGRQARAEGGSGAARGLRRLERPAMSRTAGRLRSRGDSVTSGREARRRGVR